MMSVNNLPGPPRVQIQTQAGCNGRCVFCPNDAVLKTKLPHGKMTPEVFRKIIDELAETPPRRVSLYLMNEPLSDKRMPEFVRYTAERIPSATTLITSNGTKLSEECTEALITAGLKRLKVSLQSIDPETNKAIMGYSSERVIENVLGAQRVIKRMKAKHFDFRVSMVVTSKTLHEVDRARAFWKKHGIRLVTSSLENRGGNIGIAEELNGGEMKQRSRCIRPSREMCILYNGDAVLCCVDWYRTVVLGNVAQQSVQEVWNSPRLQEIREAFSIDAFDRLPDICVQCTESASPDKHRRGLRAWFHKLVAAR